MNFRRENSVYVFNILRQLLLAEFYLTRRVTGVYGLDARENEFAKTKLELGTKKGEILLGGCRSNVFEGYFIL